MLKTPLKHTLSTGLIRLIGIPFSLMPYSWIHKIAKSFGSLAFFLGKPYRKCVMNNLAIAKDLQLKESEMQKIAKESFHNLAITTLEYFRLHRSKNNLEEIIISKNPNILTETAKHGKGLVIISSHQANWEIPMLDITRYLKGIAIGRPIKNHKLYTWILRLREMHGGKVITPKKALSTGIKELKKGHFVGMACDQALTESSYSYPFFGVRAWTTSSPALLAYKTGAPLIAVTTERINNKYHIHYSPPIWPDTTKPLREEVCRLMDHSLAIFETSIKKFPGQYFWQHKRWKQSSINHVLKKYRKDFILIILPNKEKLLEKILSSLPTLKTIYPRSFFSFMVPEKKKDLPLPFKNSEIHTYANLQDILVRDWRYQLVFDFIDKRSIRRHFYKLSATHVLTERSLHTLASPYSTDNKDRDLSQAMTLALTKKSSLEMSTNS